MLKTLYIINNSDHHFEWDHFFKRLIESEELILQRNLLVFFFFSGNNDLIEGVRYHCWHALKELHPTAEGHIQKSMVTKEVSALTMCLMEICHRQYSI